MFFSLFSRFFRFLFSRIFIRTNRRMFSFSSLFFFETRSLPPIFSCLFFCLQHGKKRDVPSKTPISHPSPLHFTSLKERKKSCFRGFLDWTRTYTVLSLFIGFSSLLVMMCTDEELSVQGRLLLLKSHIMSLKNWKWKKRISGNILCFAKCALFYSIFFLIGALSFFCREQKRAFESSFRCFLFFCKKKQKTKQEYFRQWLRHVD